MRVCARTPRTNVLVYASIRVIFSFIQSSGKSMFYRESPIAEQIRSCTTVSIIIQNAIESTNYFSKHACFVDRMFWSVFYNMFLRCM